MRPWLARGRWTRSARLRVFSCLALGGAWLLSAPLSAGLDLPFLQRGALLSPSKPAYWRYEMVELRAQAQGSLSPARQPVLEARFFRNGRPMAGLPGKDACLLRWDPNVEAWTGRWPIPFNPVLGEVEARLSTPAEPGQGELHVQSLGPGQQSELWVKPGQWLASCRFEIRGRKPYALPKGFGVMTLEPGAHGYKFRDPDGRPGYPEGIDRLFDWARFMEADALWHGGIQTQVWSKERDEDTWPWSKEHLAQVWNLAAKAKQQGLPYGPYMLTFLVGGDYQKTDYDFTKAYDRSTGGLHTLRFVSMGDPLRQRQLSAIIKRLGATPGVSYIGMDYVRNDKGGLEFTDQFLYDLGLQAPPELRDGDPLARQVWLGHMLAMNLDPSIQHQWDWWRAHKVAQVVKGILDEADVKQPIWVFSLGWKQGHQHGQDPRMLIDAGVSFNSPMFYEADQDQFPAMLQDWAHYLSGTGGSLALGQVVDTPLLHPRLGLNGPEEHYQRQMESLALLGPVTNQLGFFWHDINRAASGGRTASNAREWALAGASTFSRLREAAGTVPVSLDVTVGGAPPRLTATVRVSSLIKVPLEKLRLEPVWTSGLGRIQPGALWVRDLKAGEVRDISFTVELSDRYVRARYRNAAAMERMLAFKAHVPGDPAWPRSAFAFKYWKAQP
jgi:hypothetical protein